MVADEADGATRRKQARRQVQRVDVGVRERPAVGGRGEALGADEEAQRSAERNQLQQGDFGVRKVEAMGTRAVVAGGEEGLASRWWQ